MLPLGLRERVCALIGPEAERLAYAFGAMETGSWHANVGKEHCFVLRDRFNGEKHLYARATWSALCEVFAANVVEQVPRVAVAQAHAMIASALRLKMYLSPSALSALERLPSGVLDSSELGP